MKSIIRATPLYNFLRYCSASGLKKKVLDCGAGGTFPPLSLFYDHGFETHGIEMCDKQLESAKKFAARKGMDLNIRKGDMRKLPYERESMSFVYSFNSIFHMNKEDVAAAVKEMERVLKRDGLCFVNFLSVDDGRFGEGRKVGTGEFLQIENGDEVVHSFYEDSEADTYFNGFELLRKEKRIVELCNEEEKHKLAYIDYTMRKK